MLALWTWLAGTDLVNRVTSGAGLLGLLLLLMSWLRSPRLRFEIEGRPRCIKYETTPSGKALWLRVWLEQVRLAPFSMTTIQQPYVEVVKIARDGNVIESDPSPLDDRRHRVDGGEQTFARGDYYDVACVTGDGRLVILSRDGKGTADLPHGRYEVCLEGTATNAFDARATLAFLHSGKATDTAESVRLTTPIRPRLTPSSFALLAFLCGLLMLWPYIQKAL